MSFSVTLNGESHTLNTSPIPLATLLNQLGATAPGYAVALNGKVIPRPQWKEQSVSCGDALVLIQPIAGG